MKNEAIKNLIKEEIKKILNENEPVKTGSALAKDLRQTSIDLTKNTGKFSSVEAEGIDILIHKLLDKAQNGNLNTGVIKQLNVILDRIQ
jgi:hypothetical protein